ncbi:MAG: T9SS type A sorting domain-containing protein [Thermoanaerobaculia bacterium]|nr:T9SS type A sorting domain-containing protein [Thermoanaerobaculia bacterium]
MKINALLVALIFTLAAQTAHAQRTLPPSLRPYAENWTYTLVKSLHRAGYDMPTMPATPISANGVSPRNTLQLDSTKTFYAYNLNFPGDSLPLFRTIYQYPAPKVKIEINYQYENNGWLTLNRSTLISDDQERLVEVTAEAFDPLSQSFNPDSRLEIFPHGDSPELVDSVFTYGWDTTIQDWTRLFSIKNVFDDQDRLLENISQVDYLGTPVIFRDVYYYDANGDNHLIENFAIMDGFEFHGGRTNIVYVDHRPIEVEVLVSNDGVNFLPDSRTNYAYHLSGLIRKQMNFEWDAEKDNYRLNQTIDYFYSPDQRLVGKETAFMPLNAHEERERVSYVYIDDENLSVEWLHLWDDDLFDWVLDSKKFYYYNGLVPVRPAPSPALALQVTPNPTTGAVQFTFVNEADIKVFDLTGQMVQSRLLQPGQRLDMSALPAGEDRYRDSSVYAYAGRTSVG